MNAETEKAVRRAMETLHYVPNDMARSLAGKQSGTIALIVPDILNPFFPELARAVEDEAHQLGYTVMLCNSDYNPDKERHYIAMLQNKRIDGIILASYTIQPEQLSELSRRSVPVVVIDNCFPGHPVLSMQSKHREGAAMAVRHLLDQGCATIAHISGPVDVLSARERLLGYEETMREHAAFVPSLIASGDFQVEGGRQAMQRLLELHPGIDGVFAGNDLMAVGALKALYTAGKTVPRQVKLIGFDGIALSTVVPELSTIAQPITGMGKQAAHELIRQIRGEPVERTARELDVQLLVRGSTALN